MAQTLLNAATSTGVGSTQRAFSIPTHHTVAANMGGGVVATEVNVEIEGRREEKKGGKREEKEGKEGERKEEEE